MRRHIIILAGLALTQLLATASTVRADEVLVDTITVGAARETAHSHESLVGGQRYRLVATGMVTFAHPARTSQYDALYCFGGCTPPIHFNYQHLAFFVPGYEGEPVPEDDPGRWFAIDDLDGPGTLPYSGGHEYSVSYTWPATGKLSLRTAINYDPEDTGLLSGSFTVQVFRESETTSCPAPQNGLRALATGQAPKITSVSVPQTAPADQLIPFLVNFSDPDGDVIIVVLEELEAVAFDVWAVKGFVPLTPGPKEGSIGAGTICENAFVFDESHTVRFTVGDKECGQDVSDTIVYKCVTKPVGLRVEQAFGVGAASAATFAAAAFEAPLPTAVRLSPPVVKGVLVTGGLLWLGQAAMNIYNNDPPDPNFMILAEPTLPPVPVLVAEDTLTPDLAGSLNGLIGHLAEFVGVARAVVTSLERAQGAAQAQDVFWFVEQIRQASDLTARWAELFVAYSDLAAGVQVSWQAAGIPETLTTDNVVSAQNKVAASGLPSTAVDVFTGLGMTDTDVAGITDAVIAQDPEQAAGPITTNLAPPELKSALAEEGAAIGRFSASIKPSGGGCGSCDDGNPCTDDACQAGSGCTHTPRPGVEGLACLVDRLLPANCGTTPRGVTNGLAKAHTLAEGARANPTKAAKLLLKARKALAKVAKAAAKAKKKSKLSAECADALTANITDLRGRIKSFASS